MGRMKTTMYHDTRGLDGGRKPFSEVLVRGIAPGGGLYVPVELPSLSLEEILVFASWPYWRRAAAVFTRFGIDIPSQRVDFLMQKAYGSQWDDERIAPVEEVVPGTWVLELWHGPTSAFKDMALQCMPLFFSESVERRRQRGLEDHDYLILVATSGDTGKAALEGFADREHTSIVVFYPADGVSDIQRKQMVTQHGENVGVFGVRGNFDDCQSAVKAAFSDSAFADKLDQTRLFLIQTEWPDLDYLQDLLRHNTAYPYRASTLPATRFPALKALLESELKLSTSNRVVDQLAWGMGWTVLIHLGVLMYATRTRRWGTAAFVAFVLANLLFVMAAANATDYRYTYFAYLTVFVEPILLLAETARPSASAEANLR